MNKIIPDLMFFAGLGVFGYGLWLYQPWVGFASSGAVLFIVGILAGRGDS